MRGRLECCEDLRVNRDVEVAFHGLLGVSNLHLLQYPFTERLADDAVGDVTDPLLGQLRELLLDGHVPLELEVVAPLSQDRLEVEALVLRDGEVAEGSGADITERGLVFDAFAYRLRPMAMSLRK